MTLTALLLRVIALMLLTLGNTKPLPYQAILRVLALTTTTVTEFLLSGTCLLALLITLLAHRTHGLLAVVLVLRVKQLTAEPLVLHGKSQASN